MRCDPQAASACCTFWCAATMDTRLVCVCVCADVCATRAKSFACRRGFAYQLSKAFSLSQINSKRSPFAPHTKPGAGVARDGWGGSVDAQTMCMRMRGTFKRPHWLTHRGRSWARDDVDDGSKLSESPSPSSPSPAVCRHGLLALVVVELVVVVVDVVVAVGLLCSLPSAFNAFCGFY